jgi:hypothetical protein
MGVKNRNDVDHDLRALRRSEAASTPAQAVGYRNRAGQTVAQPGNDKAPYVWNAPFSDPMQAIGTLPELKDTHEYPIDVPDLERKWGTCFPAIDVSDYRVVSFLMVLQTPDPDLTLQILPLVQFAFLDEALELEPFNIFDVWSPIAFVKPDPTNVQTSYETLGGDAEQTLVQRTMGGLALKTIAPGGTEGGLVSLAMDFEVSSHKQLTLSTIYVDGDPDGAQVRYYYTRRM